MDDVEQCDRTWQVHCLTTLPSGEIVGTTQTNDNEDTGYPGEFASWPVRYKDYDSMKASTGLSHTGCIGCEVTVRLDGKII